MAKGKEKDNSDKSDLNQFDPQTYGDKYQEHFIEQYKMYVEMADRISARRIQANSFFLGINTTLIAAGGALYRKKYSAPPEIVLIVIVAILTLCYTWWCSIKSYGQLNSVKFKIITLLEKHLPSAPYSMEWTMLDEGKNPMVYYPLTTIERLIPFLFAILFIILGTCIAFPHT